MTRRIAVLSACTGGVLLMLMLAVGAAASPGTVTLLSRTGVPFQSLWAGAPVDGGAGAVAVSPVPGAWNTSLEGDGATWIWSESPVSGGRGLSGDVVEFNDTFQSGCGSYWGWMEVDIDITADNEYKILLNGTQIADSGWAIIGSCPGTPYDQYQDDQTYSTVYNHTWSGYMPPGTNSLDFQVLNLPCYTDGTNPGGLIYKADIEYWCWDVTLEPASDLNLVGTTHDMIMTVTTEPTGGPTDTLPVYIYVQGVNSPPALDAETSLGEANFSYAGSAIGMDTIRACIDVDDSGSCEADEPFDAASKEWFGYDLGDWVWYDTDQDGIQDGGEPGVQGIYVELFNNGTCSGGSVSNDSTDVNGYYLFPDRVPDTYCLEFSSIPSNADIALQNQGFDDSLDSDANPATGRITSIALSADDLDEDMGLFANGRINGWVWCSTDNVGLDKISVWLYDDPDCDGDEINDGTHLATEVTDEDGFYQFDDVPAGPPGSPLCYVVRVDDTDPDLGDCPDPLSPVRYGAQLVANGPEEIQLPDFVFWLLWLEEFVPEWGSIALLGSGLAGLAGYATLRWRKK
jgi:hypothetical protein